MLSGATDLETLPGAGGHEGADALAAAAASTAPECGRTELRPGNVDELLPAADRIPASATEQPPGGAAQPELGSRPRCPPRARWPSAASATPRSRATGAAPTASISSARCACRRSTRRSPTARAAERGPRRPAARHARAPAARAPRLRPAARPDRGRGGRADRVARGARAGRGGGRPARHGRAVRGLRALRARIAAPRRVRAELPFAFTLSPAGSGRAQPAGQRRRGRARRRGLGPARGGLQERCPRRPRPRPS